MSKMDFNTTTTTTTTSPPSTRKRAACSYIGGVGDGLADDSDSLQNAVESGYVVQGRVDKVYRVTKPIKWYSDTILINCRIVYDCQDNNVVLNDWTGMSDMGLFILACEISSKCKQGTVILKIDNPVDENVSQRSYLDLVQWSNVKVRKSEDQKYIEFYTYP